MKKTKKIWLGILFAVLFIVAATCWCLRVKKLNSKFVYPEYVYGMNDTFDYGNLEITPIEGKIMSADEFYKYFGVNPESNGDEMICLKIHLKYIGDESVTNDEINQFTNYGFRTVQSSNGMDPFLWSDINNDEIYKLIDDGECDMWLFTNIPACNWKKSHYEKLDTYTFYYVLSIFPESIKIQVN